MKYLKHFESFSKIYSYVYDEFIEITEIEILNRMRRWN